MPSRLAMKSYPTRKCFGVTLKLWGGGWWTPGRLDALGHDRSGQVRERVERDVREREHVGSRRIARVRDRDDAHPGGVGGSNPVRRILDRRTLLRSQSEPSGCFEVDVRGGLAAPDLFRRHRHLEE